MTPRMVLAACGCALIATAVLAPSASAATFKKGRYSGTTTQERVEKETRTIEFRVKGSKISLTQEPGVARNFCLSSPVFLLDVDKVTTKLRGNGGFSFSSIFIGSKFHSIRGQFNEKGEIDGTATYWFRDSDSGSCGAGRSEVKFTAKLRKG